jgi:hypothetical protein
MRNPLRDLRGIPEGTFRADPFYTQAIFRADNSPIPNKLVGRQFTGGNPHRSPPRCVRTGDAQTGTWFGPDSGRRSGSCLPPIRSGSQIAAGFGPSHLSRPLDAKEPNFRIAALLWCQSVIGTSFDLGDLYAFLALARIRFSRAGAQAVSSRRYEASRATESQTRTPRTTRHRSRTTGARKFSRPLLLRAHREVTRRANCARSTRVG